MAMDRTEAAMTAIADAMLADAQIAALVDARVYAEAPEGVASPYITIGDVGYSDSSTSDSEAQDFQFDVHVFDIPQDVESSKDTSRVRALMAHIRRVLHDAPLVIAGANRIVCRVTRAIPVLATPDEIQGVITIRVLAGHE